MNPQNWCRRRTLSAVSVGLGGLLLGGWRLTSALAQPVREIEIVARRFKFEPNVIPLHLDEPVMLLVHSLDFVHGFSVPDLGLRADLLPGMVTRIPLQPRHAGQLDFLCDNFCGQGHEDMHGHFEVLG